ncbi:cys/Met metabolism PLP-dependent enzyme family protein [Mycobacteroides abscessus]|uniref:PLP-dependent transferase n=1 Tax=Mycobacteroides abscessus TaxID=36809 RepID=UPI0004494BDB|nr:PLP-dependent transferase [Mycobacteroides abscessus]EUA66124.1 cys/Met metabolism PLP-dependent enzyme family protein [Mycobacteroides abscessus]
MRHANDSAYKIGASSWSSTRRCAGCVTPFLGTHPQYELAKRQMRGGGTVVTFELDADGDAGKQRAFQVLDGTSLIDISNNLGRLQVAHHPPGYPPRTGPWGRRPGGDRLSDGVVRLSVGLESTDDLIADLERALG